MNAFLLPVVLQVLGALVLIAEFVLPSAGILTVIAASLIGYSLYMVFTGISTFAGYMFILADIFLLPVVVFAGFKLMASSPVTLKSSLSRDAGYSSQSETLTGWLDKTGEAITDLRPAGTARIDGKRVDVVSRGEYISKGSLVRVTTVDGNRVVVREISK
jgi:membrane-bound ClpP family serine protease